MRTLNSLFLVILVSILPLLSLFHPGLPITHDGQDHVARIANFYLSLSEGNIIPRWANNLNWGYGHPILMFLYPFPSYLASVFHFLGLSLVDSVKAVFGFSYILSGLFMFLWLRNFLGKFPAITGAIIYLYAPYRFVDLYVRGAIGEHAAFIFIPAICYFLLKLNTKEKFNFVNFFGISISTAGLILSHNAISLMFLPFVVFYVFFLFLVNKSSTFFPQSIKLKWKNEERYRYSKLLGFKKVLDKNKILLGASIAGIFYGFLLSAFFWIPAFVEGKYTLRDIVTKNEALTRFVDFHDLIYGSWNFGGTGSFSTELGIIPWIFVLFLPIGVYLLYKRSKQEKNNLILLGFSALFLFVSIFLMLEISKPVWIIITTLQKFQFPWRFLSVSVFSISLISALVVYSLKNQKMQKIFFLTVLISSVLMTYNYWKAKDFLYKPESFYSGIYNSTTDTGESAPIWSVRFMEKKPTSEIEFIEGEGRITKISRTSKGRSYEIVSKDKSKIRENTLYFPGWKVLVDGKEQALEFQDPNSRGLMTFFLNNGRHKVDIEFGNTKLRTAADSVSLISFFGLVLLIIGSKRKWLKN